MPPKPSFYGVNFFSVFSLIWSPASSCPPANFPLSYDSYQTGRVKNNTWILRDTWSQQTAFVFRPSAQATSQGSLKHLHLSTIFCFPHTWASRDPHLANVTMIDNEDRVYYPFFPDSEANIPPLAMHDCEIVRIWTCYLPDDSVQHAFNFNFIILFQGLKLWT